MSTLEVELVKVIPSILWFLLTITALAVFYRPLRDELLPNLTGFSAMGVEVSFIRDSMDAAIELAQKSPQWNVAVSPAEKT